MKHGIYKHYKGGEYEVLGLVLHTETREKLVLYRALYPVTDLDLEFGLDPMFVRPYEQFMEQAIVDGCVVPRFTLIKEIEDGISR